MPCCRWRVLAGRTTWGAKPFRTGSGVIGNFLRHRHWYGILFAISLNQWWHRQTCHRLQVTGVEVANKNHRPEQGQCVTSNQDPGPPSWLFSCPFFRGRDCQLGWFVLGFTLALVKQERSRQDPGLRLPITAFQALVWRHIVVNMFCTPPALCCGSGVGLPRSSSGIIFPSLWATLWAAWCSSACSSTATHRFTHSNVIAAEALMNGWSLWNCFARAWCSLDPALSR